MAIFLSIAITVIVLFGAFFLWGVARLRKRNAKVAALIKGLRIGDINHLLAEGKERLAKVYGLTIDFADVEGAAKNIDSLFLNRTKLENAFRKPGFDWYFVFPVGALIGEFIRINAKGVWKESPEGLMMDIPVRDGAATCYPFEKVLKQVNQGDKGDMYAFLISSTQLSTIDPAHDPSPK
jgi:hypothetical protein